MANNIGGAHKIIFANEKGGTGKSTTAVHVAVALAYQGAKVFCIDLDARQATLGRYLENRGETIKRREIDLPIPDFAVFGSTDEGELQKLIDEKTPLYDFILIDTPGRDDPLARMVATQAHSLVTPMNDSFVDFDLIGQVDAENFKVKRLSFYAEMIFEARKKRALSDGVTIDWVVLRNRLTSVDARNQHRMSGAISELSKRVGFRSISGLNERVIYRELFPSGLTLLDKGHLGQLGTTHIIARQELRELVSGLNLKKMA
ncbi:ATPase [Sphingorhabdus lutea]|uniref:ATPase n=1 Tax=Sphingorhabdus lutea TaxID=1913578 RepID=A0A1L3J9Q3_9SPHN|nr:division plane positioning ATPase MipZ [Sphingorhabdus lutea]APG61844.1 ATPase [Sphingorhabdus lutea]